jgi:hypothetical protein
MFDVWNEERGTVFCGKAGGRSSYGLWGVFGCCWRQARALIRVAVLFTIHGCAAVKKRGFSPGAGAGDAHRPPTCRRGSLRTPPPPRAPRPGVAP